MTVANLPTFLMLSRLSNDSLIAATEQAAKNEQECTAALVAHLAEMERRGLYRNMAYDSMFNYCTRHLGLSDAAAFLRIRAARLALQFPEVLDLIASGRLHLTALNLISKHLNQTNYRGLLAAVCGKTRREVEKFVAMRFPDPERRDTLQRLPQREVTKRKVEWASPPPVSQQNQPQSMASMNGEKESEPEDAHVKDSRNPLHINNLKSPTLFEQSYEQEQPPAPNHTIPHYPASYQPQPQPQIQPHPNPKALVVPADRVVPTGPERYRLAVTLDEEGYALLEQVKALMCHRISGNDMGAVITEALELLRDRLETERFGSRRSRKTAKNEKKSGATPDDEHCPSTTEVADSGQGHPVHVAEPVVEEVNCEKQTLPEQSSPVQVMAEINQPESNAQPDSAQLNLTLDSGNSNASPTDDKHLRYIPKQIRRAVYERDDGRCTFTDPATGRQCSSRRVQLHHINPWCKGGPHTAANLTLRCHAHNSLAAEEDLGSVARFARHRS